MIFGRGPNEFFCMWIFTCPNTIYWKYYLLKVLFFPYYPDFLSKSIVSLYRSLLLFHWFTCCCCSVTHSWLVLCNPMDSACQATMSFTISWSLIKLMSTESVMPSNHLGLCHPLLLLPPIFPASGSFPVSRLFAADDQSIRAWPAASVLPVNTQDWSPLGLTGLISLQTKGLSSVFNTSLKASILHHSAFFMVQLSHPYMTTGKTMALTRGTCVSKKMSLLFNTLSRFVIAFLPRSKHLLISWLQSPSQWFWSWRKYVCPYSSTTLFKNDYRLSFCNLFIYFCLCWIFVAVLRLSLVVVSGGLLFVVIRELRLLQRSGPRACGL